jgi:TatA/E family protein of Tat protein translocase
MFNIGITELVLILVIALIVFGPSKLPEVSKALGKSMREFRKATNEINGEVSTQEEVTAIKDKTDKEEHS